MADRKLTMLDCFEDQLSFRSARVLLQFFYGPEILLPYNTDAREVFQACLEPFRSEYGNGTPILPLAVAALHEAELLRMPCIGRVSAKEIKSALESVGLRFGMSKDELIARARGLSDPGWEWNLLEGVAA